MGAAWTRRRTYEPIPDGQKEWKHVTRSTLDQKGTLSEPRLTPTELFARFKNYEVCFPLKAIKGIAVACSHHPRYLLIFIYDKPHRPGVVFRQFLTFDTRETLFDFYSRLIHICYAQFPHLIPELLADFDHVLDHGDCAAGFGP